MRKNSKIIIAVLCIIALFTSCRKEKDSVKTPDPVKKNPAAYLINDAQRASINSITNLDGGKLYSMNYTADYMLDKLLKSPVSNVDSLKSFIKNNLLTSDTPLKLDIDGGCSAFQVKDAGGNILYGRNYDYKMNSATVMIRTKPEKGYESIGLACAGWMQYPVGSLDDGITDLSNAISLPYLIMDGMNEKGLTVSVLKLDSIGTQQDTGKDKVMTTVAMRLILDRTATVQEALDTLMKYDMQSAMTDANFHFLISDATGRTVVLEYCINDMQVVDANYVTNYYLHPSMHGLGHGKDRYAILKSTIDFKENVLSMNESKLLLEMVSQAPGEAATSMTQWSVVYDITNLNASVSVLRDYEKWHDFGF